MVASLLRFALLFRYRFDSDEPQHMHVAWAWAHGLMQYRDVFDNHMPLFQLLSAPLFRAAGDDPNALYLARIAVLPLFAASLALVYVISRRLSGQRIAAWATAITAVFPPFFLGMLEYRTDDLWVVLWLAVIAVLISDLEPLARAVAAGALLGFAFGVSMKSILFAVAIVTATLGTVLLTPHRSGAQPLREVSSRLVTMLATALIVPATIATAFALAGAWRQFAYCVLWHNASAPLDHMWWRMLWIIPLGPLTLRVARRYAISEGDDQLVRRRLFVFLSCATFVVILSAFWPILSLESYLPFYPLAILLVAPILVPLGDRFESQRHLPAFAMSAVILLTGVTTAAGKVWRDEAHEEVALIRQVLQITRPDEQVMDLKGESLFRRRPYWLVLESITHRKLRHHVLHDDIAAALVRSGTAVLASTDFPDQTRAFVQRNYVPWGRLWVVGHCILPAPSGGRGVPLRVGVPSRYIVVDAHGLVGASIDGVPVGEGGLELSRGMHSVQMSRTASRPLIVWAGVTRSSRFLTRLQETEERLRTRGEDVEVRRMAGVAVFDDVQ
ncbi:MAG: hypothetical protein NVSMB68_02580 [Thermoanaerobaculia bacterium]